jgi:sorbitol-specific phosphotransferase system component IIA
MTPTPVIVVRMTDEDRRWNAHLYRRHSPRELRDWATRLRWFRLCRAFGGHNNDGDDLRLALRATTERELADVLAVLGITELGHVRIAGESAFASTRPGRIELRLSDPARRPALRLPAVLPPPLGAVSHS